MFIDEGLLLSYIFPLLIVNFIFVLTTRNKAMFYNMQYLYFRMKDDQVGVVNIHKKLFTQAWLDRFIKEGYTFGQETTQYVYYYRFISKLDHISNKGEVLECVFIAKRNAFDFYSEEVDREIDQILMLNNKGRNIKKIVVLQYKRYNELNDKVENEIDQIICFTNRFQYLIHITVGYFEKDNQVYFLNPKTKYANKYYYYGCQEIRKQIGLFEE